MKTFIKKIIPVFLVNWYHYGLSLIGAIWYGFPSKKLIVIGVTGTKGKTTVSNLICQILNECGLKSGMASTVNFRIGDKEWVNTSKQTMLGRLSLQKLLRQMVQEKCKYAVVETSSEGILQHRHRNIDYSIAVFTNLSPEHIERHGSFENYKKAKLKLFEIVAQKKDGIGVYNLDNEHAGDFIVPKIAHRIGFSTEGKTSPLLERVYIVSDIQLFANRSEFLFEKEKIIIPLIGKFNVYNAATAMCVALSQGLQLQEIKKALLAVEAPAGRFEIIDEGQNFKAIADYSYEPLGLENALKTAQVFNPNRVIVVFGSAAGGRDHWRRAAMGKIADKLADVIFVTTDDPYDEEPAKIIEDIAKVVLENPKRILSVNVFKVVDRREAIQKALQFAKANDVVLFSGKGGEQWMNIAHGKKIPWQEAVIVREELQKLKNIPS